MHHPFIYLNLALYALFAALLVAAAIIDARKRIIPNAIIIALIAAWLVQTIATTATLCASGIPLTDTLATFHAPLNLSPVTGIVAALLFGLGSLLVTTAFERITGKFAMGGGDIKLLFAIGLFLGIEREAVALLLACATFIAISLVSALVPRKLRAATPMPQIGQRTLSDPFPFGPFLALGAIVALLC